ncbi:unnamed protein product, partial [Didymodactylos carnosus]
PLLFTKFCELFYPTMICIIVDSKLDYDANVQNVLKCLLSDKMLLASDHLVKKVFRFVTVNDENTFDHKLFSDAMQSKLNEIKISAENVYNQLLKEELSTASKESHKIFLRSMNLTNLLHLQTKCDILKKKLSIEECLLFKYHDNIDNHFSQQLIDDVTRTAHNAYNLIELDECLEKQNINDMTDMVKKIVDKLHLTENIPKTFDHINLAQTYIAQKLITQGGLLVQHQYVSNLEWFCHTINTLLNMKAHKRVTNDQTVLSVEQFSAVGQNATFLTYPDLMKEIGKDYIQFFQTVFDTWNIMCSFTTNNETIIVPSTAVPSMLTVPLFVRHSRIQSISNKLYLRILNLLFQDTVWSTNWNNELESVIIFDLIQPCDESILFILYNSLPCQKLLLASTNLLLIQDGAIEILIRLQTSKRLLLQCRTIDLYRGDDGVSTNSVASQLNEEMLNYISREYYILIWTLLLKLDYAFTIVLENENFKNEESTFHQWSNISLYHYFNSSQITGICSLCGLTPSASKSLYDACSTLAPLTKLDFVNPDKRGDGSISETNMIMKLYITDKQIEYCSRSSLRPDGCNAFELTILGGKDEHEVLNTNIQIGCSVKNFGIELDEKISFIYGEIKITFQDAHTKLLNQIKNAAGFVQKTKWQQNKMEKSGSTYDGGIYHGLKLRIEMILTQTVNVFEFIFYINNLPWSRQTYKKKSTKSIFQPYFSYVTFESTSVKQFSIAIHYPRTSLDLEVRQDFDKVVSTKGFKIGMRLEAKDRKNPFILAIANITDVHDDNSITINFDGWGSNFDYTVEMDNADLHPAGYWEYVQRVLYKNVVMNQPHAHFTFSRFDPPKSYAKAFSWRNYLSEIDAEPVSYECFSYAQNEGMPIDFFPFGETKQVFTNSSCRHLHNPRIKYQKLFTYVQNELVNQLLTQHRIEDSTIALTISTSRGLVLLPTQFDSLNILKYPCLKKFKDDLRLHMTCNHR